MDDFSSYTSEIKSPSHQLEKEMIGGLAVTSVVVMRNDKAISSLHVPPWKRLDKAAIDNTSSMNNNVPTQAQFEQNLPVLLSKLSA